MGTTPQIIVKIPNHRIKAREREAMKGAKMPIHTVATWVQRQLSKVKVFLAVVSGIAVLVFLHAHERGEDLEKKKRKEISICSHLFVKKVFWSLNCVPPRQKPCARHVLLISI